MVKCQESLRGWQWKRDLGKFFLADFLHEFTFLRVEGLTSWSLCPLLSHVLLWVTHLVLNTIISNHSNYCLLSTYCVTNTMLNTLVFINLNLTTPWQTITHILLMTKVRSEEHKALLKVIHSKVTEQDCRQVCLTPKLKFFKLFHPVWHNSASTSSIS